MFVSQVQTTASIMFAYICWREVEEEVEYNGQYVDNTSKNIAPSPLQLSGLVEGSCDWGTKYGERDRCRQYKRVHGTSQGVWNELAKYDVERKLASCGKSIDGIRCLRGGQRLS
jgi:hypothetical protein